MKKNTLAANVIVWGALSVGCVAFLIWAASIGGDFGENMALLTFNVFARPIAAYSLAALVTTLVVWKTELKLGRTARIVWRALGIVPAALLLLSPFVIPVLPKGVAALFAVTLLAAMAVPVVFVLFGVCYGLALAGEKPAEPDSEPEDPRA